MSSDEISRLMALIDEWRSRAERIQHADTEAKSAGVSGAASRQGDPGDAASRRSGAPTILVVDDEDDARILIREILQSAGYTVLEARDGNEGLLVADWHEGPIDLVITDVIMPYLDGGEFGERVRALRAETKVLYISGYASNALVEAGRRGESVAFLPKPFGADELERQVRALLGLETPG